VYKFVKVISIGQGASMKRAGIYLIVVAAWLGCVAVWAGDSASRAPGLVGGPEWALVPGASSPEARSFSAMAYDGARKRVVLFGGFNGSSILGDTWEWDGSSWIQRAPATSPPSRANHAMAYDSVRGRVVLFGGINWEGGGNNILADTWEWDGNTWVERTPATGPPARMSHAMACDSPRQRTVLFGGWTGFSLLADTWEWDGNAWVESTPATSPAARYANAMAYDGERGRAVLFGGGGETSPYLLADTWEWNGATWVDRTPATSPPPRSYHALAYDSSRERLVLFGGVRSYVPDSLADTWEWNGSAWVETTPATSPAARYAPAMAYDGARGRMLLFGGLYVDGGTYHYLGDTWEYRVNLPPAADAGANQVLECTGDGVASVTLDGSRSSDPDSTPGSNDDIVSFVWSENDSSLASGERVSVPLEAGTHDMLLTVSDRSGATGTDDVIVSVQDKTPPVINSIAANPGTLWPPNHQFVAVEITVAAADVCDTAPECEIVSVTSTEPARDSGNGRTGPNWVINDSGPSSSPAKLGVLLRAERSHGGPGRAYTITVSCNDAAGNTQLGQTTVTVAHDQRR
jgi:hypothetical protein